MTDEHCIDELVCGDEGTSCLTPPFKFYEIDGFQLFVAKLGDIHTVHLYDLATTRCATEKYLRPLHSKNEGFKVDKFPVYL